MGFFTEEEQKAYVKDIFRWTDGKAYRLYIKKRIEENFSDGKKSCVLEFLNFETAERFEMKYQFSLMNALHKLGEAYKDDRTPLEVTAHYGGKNTKNYDVWDFDIRVMDTFEVPQRPPEYGTGQEIPGIKVEDIPY